jgi:hypothetical protein
LAIYRGPGGSGDAINDASSEVLLALQAKNAAIAAQVAAEAAQAAAELAETNAETAETNAETAETNAETAETNAETAATNAASSASAASTSATNASNSASAASTSATNASNSASAASTSASNASSSASSATSSASTATTQATNASNSASAASTSATNASNSASAASTSATNAAASATSASGSASTATTQASNAASSASAASTSASNASTSATNASNSASAASTSASNAATSATNASNSASAASTSATNASNAQTAAEAARDATLTAYDNFDDRYLGSKTSDPSLDNDGNALVGGSLYFNSVSGIMKVYTGSAWVAAYVSGADYLAKANNLSDLTNTATARTNLGLAIGTDVQAYDADLATIAGLTPTNNYAIIGNGTSWTSSALSASGVTSVTGTSPISSSGGSTPAISLDNSGVTANTYGSSSSIPVITVSAKGLITAVSTSTVDFGAGTAALPSITTTGDTNTGIYFPAADTIAFTEGGVESMRINSSGAVGLGTSSITGKFTIYNNVGSNYHQISNITRPSSTTPALFMGTNGNSNNAAIASNNSALCFGYDTSNTFNELVRIATNNELLIGCTASPTASISGVVIANPITTLASAWSVGNFTSEVVLIRWINGNGVVGGIVVNGSATTYSTSSDYRLKENVAPMTGALAKVTQLKPVTYTWKADGSSGQGFIAHELQAIVPDAVTGEKDSVDDDGNIKPQGVDTSFLVATLTAAIQELNAKVEAQAVRIAELEGAR